jgi:hypothetical protein
VAEPGWLTLDPPMTYRGFSLASHSTSVLIASRWVDVRCIDAWCGPHLLVMNPAVPVGQGAGNDGGKTSRWSTSASCAALLWSGRDETERKLAGHLVQQGHDHRSMLSSGTMHCSD